MSSYTKEKLQYLLATKRMIREAIEKKGQPVNGFDTFRSYADKISAIEAGYKDPVLKVAGGMINVTSTDAVTVTHNLGVIPDVVMVFLCELDEGKSISYDTKCFGGEIAYSAEAIADGLNRNLYNITGAAFGVPWGIYGTNDDADILGCVRNATPKRLTLGGSTSWPMLIGASYRWIAVGGIKVHPAYLNVTLELDGDGGLIVHGGAPEISQLEIYVDGTLGKTVDYTYSENFTVDISDVAAEVKEYTISVKATGEGLDETYQYQFFEPVTGWVLPKARGTCGENVTWTLGNDGTLTIKGEGAMTDFEWVAARPWDNYNANIEKVEVKDGVTNVGTYAFYYTPKNFPNLHTVELAPSVKTIGKSAFYQCTGLQNVTIPEGVETIKDSAFLQTGITRLSLPASIKTIEQNAFKGCTSLASLDLPDGITTLGTQHTFSGCTALKSVVIPGSVREICQCAFYGCTALADVTISEGITSLGSSAFSNKCAYENIVVPDTVTTIGDAVFNNAPNLTTVTIGSGVTSMGKNVFYGTALTSAVFKVTSGWQVSTSSEMTSSTILYSLDNTSTAAKYLKTTHAGKYWARS